jgi:hypothetical protein
MKLKNLFAAAMAALLMFTVMPITAAAQIPELPTGQTVICVSPSGSASGQGTQNFPLDIYTAVESALPGQTIVLAGGMYSLNRPLVIDRGNDGTSGARITLMANPNTSGRPVLNAGGNGAAIVLAGDYWYLQGFDITGSADGQPGIRVSGNNNTLDQINTYENGGSGIEISRYLPTDTRENWPSGNLILNCSSYGNTGSGNEADGFAASYTVGDNNVFDGCIAHHNAGDGFDISAALETGAIGQVVIQNSVSYKNGYLQNNTPAGSGRGFKMGSTDISGYHTLINSIAFENRGAGINTGDVSDPDPDALDEETYRELKKERDSKRGAPDVIIQNCTSFNNENYNVQLDTATSPNTDYSATGFISYRTENTDVRELIAPKGRQNITKFYNTTSYYWNENYQPTPISVNSQMDQVYVNWFESLTFGAVTRNADGTVNMNGFLVLTSNAPTDTGARISGTPSPVFSVDMPPEPQPEPQPIPQPEQQILPQNDMMSNSSSDSSPYYAPVPNSVPIINRNAPRKFVSNGVTAILMPDGTVIAALNPNGTVNGNATAAAVRAAKMLGKGAITVTIPEGAIGISKSACARIYRAARGTPVTLVFELAPGTVYRVKLTEKTGQIVPAEDFFS